MLALTIACAALTTISCRTSEAPEAKLYAEREIQAMREKFMLTGPDSEALHARNVFPLNVVPNGETKKFHKIFEQLGLDPERLEKPDLGGANMVRIYHWRVSPGFVLEIMAATNDPENDFSHVSNLNGYGVSIYEKHLER